MKMDVDKLTAEERSELAKQARRIYYRNWRRANSDKVKQYNERYWLKKTAIMMETEEEPQAGVDD